MMKSYDDYDKESSMKSYVIALEEERKKILVFERELPLSLHLVTQAIESCRHRGDGDGDAVDDDEMKEKSMVLEEFLPLGPTSNLQSSSASSTCCNATNSNKPDWLRSAQLWNQPSKQLEDVAKRPVAERVGAGGAFHPFDNNSNKKDEICNVKLSSDAALESNRGGREEENVAPNSQRKQRRAWSPELHRRFLKALQQLGGSHAATPKQIRELMKVDGLTNDEVKSHLQKYRLHTRRPSNGTTVESNNTSSSTRIPQIVLWMQPPQYAGNTTADVTAAASALNRIYSAPIASATALPSEVELKRSPTGPLSSGEQHCSGRTNSDSSATASSFDKTVASRYSSNKNLAC